MTNKELLRNLIAEIDFIMHDKDYRFLEGENAWYSRKSCKVLTPEEVFEELRAELLQLNNETNSEITELKEKAKKLEYDNGELVSLIDTMRYDDPKIAELQKQLEEKGQSIEHWHNLYQERDRQFQSVRQRYHLLNRLKSNYNEKDKLHLSEMQCLELVEENEKLQQQLHSQPAEIVEKIKQELGFIINNKERVVCDGSMTGDKYILSVLDNLLKEYQK